MRSTANTAHETLVLIDLSAFLHASLRTSTASWSLNDARRSLPKRMLRRLEEMLGKLWHLECVAQTWQVARVYKVQVMLAAFEIQNRFQPLLLVH